MTAHFTFNMYSIAKKNTRLLAQFQPWASSASVAWSGKCSSDDV